MTRPRIKFTVQDYMSTPEGTRFQLLDGEMVLAQTPDDKHQAVVGALLVALYQFAVQHRVGQVRVSPYDVVLSQYDVAQPDILFVSNERAGIFTPANIQGAPDLVVEVISPSSAPYDRGYKRTLYSRTGVLEYWLVDPVGETVAVLAREGDDLVPHATFGRNQELVSDLLPGFRCSLDQIFGQE